MLTSLNLSQPLVGNPGTPGIPPNTTIASAWVDVSSYYGVIAVITQADAPGTLYIDFSDDKVTYSGYSVAYTTVQQLSALAIANYARIRIVTGSSYTTSGYATLGSTSMPIVPPIPNDSPNLAYDSNLANAIATEGTTWTVYYATIGTNAGNMNVINPGTANAAFVLYGTGAVDNSHQQSVSQIISVIPGQTYTLSQYINFANSSAGNVRLGIVSTGTFTPYADALQNAGLSGVVSVTWTAPSGVTQILIQTVALGQNILIGETVSWSQPNFTQTSTVQPYQPGPLWIGNVAAGNIFSTETVTAVHLNSTPNTSVTLTPSANPLVSGTVYQNLTGGPVQVMQPITGTTAGTAQIALGPTSTPPNYGGAETIPLNSVKNISFIVPNGWYCSITSAGTTFGTTQLIGY